MVLRRGKPHVLKRPKIRQTWNKYNLYNLSRLKLRIRPSRTFFQQKWYAKAATRPYHGETILEQDWTRMFRPTLRSVVPMNPRRLAQDDGSREARGRGSGLEDKIQDDARGVARNSKKKAVPFMNMVFAGMERRLDTAIFRALFASSTRQARQFCVHGYVKVNGKKMQYPAYQLNPGDMFQVDPERVMYATGASKGPRQRTVGRRLHRKQKNIAMHTKPSAEQASAVPRTTSVASDKETDPEKARETLQQLLTQAEAMLQTEKFKSSSAAQKRNFRLLKRLLQRTLSRPLRGGATAAGVDAQIAELMAKLSISVGDIESNDNASGAPSSLPSSSTSTTATTHSTPGQSITIQNEQRRRLEQALATVAENTPDPSKPYATPWRPRPWMSPFAFIPRYLEVHHRICAAVYLRHPVARPQLAEVPTPFSQEINELAFNWYLRRR